MARLGGKILYVATLAAVTALSFGNWVMVNEQIETAPIVPVATASASASGEAELASSKNLTLSELAETVARPLFTATRRPAPPRETAGQTPASMAEAAMLVPQASPAPPSNLRLIGMINDGGEMQRALLQNDNGPSTNWVTVGAEFSGWHLTSIEKDSVTVEQLGTRSVLKLHPPGPAAHPIE